MFKITLLMAAAAPFIAMPALAQTDEPFTGFHLEAVGGWDRAQANHHKKDGFLYGGAAGYDLASGTVRVGAEAEVTGSTEKACDAVTGGRECVKPGRDIYVGGRVGVLAAPALLVYGKAGYTNARITTDLSSGAGLVRSTSDDRSGIRLGAGAEYAVTDRFFLKTEYRYSNYSGHMGRNQIIAGAGVRF